MALLLYYTSLCKKPIWWRTLSKKLRRAQASNEQLQIKENRWKLAPNNGSDERSFKKTIPL
jgi:hypothetical protein